MSVFFVILVLVQIYKQSTLKILTAFIVATIF